MPKFRQPARAKLGCKPRQPGASINSLTTVLYWIPREWSRIHETLDPCPSWQAFLLLLSLYI